MYKYRIKIDELHSGEKKYYPQCTKDYSDKWDSITELQVKIMDMEYSKLLYSPTLGYELCYDSEIEAIQAINKLKFIHDQEFLNSIKKTIYKEIE